MFSQLINKQGSIVVKLLLHPLSFWFLLVLGLFHRFFRMTYVCYWFDEYASIRTIQLPWSALFSGSYMQLGRVGEMNPPLYFLLLKSWVFLWGEQEWILRLLSEIFSGFSLLLIYWIGRKLLGTLAARAALLIVGGHPLYIHYATEIRSYALLTFLSLLGFLAFIKLLDDSPSSRFWKWVLGISLWLTIQVHAFGIFSWTAIFFLVLGRKLFEKDNVGELMRIWVWSGVVSLPFLCWCWVQRLGYLATHVPGNPSLGVDMTLPLALLSGKGETIFRWNDPIQYLLLAGSVLGLLGLVRSGKTWIACSSLAIILFSAGAAYIFGHRVLFLYSRYLIVINLFSIILQLGCFHDSEKHRFRLTQAMSVILSLLFLWGSCVTSWRQHNNEGNWRQIADFIRQQIPAQKTLLLTTWDALPLQLYLGDRKMTYFNFLPANWKSTCLDSQYVWVKTRRTQPRNWSQQVHFLTSIPSEGVEFYSGAPPSQPPIAEGIPSIQHSERSRDRDR